MGTVPPCYRQVGSKSGFSSRPPRTPSMSRGTPSPRCCLMDVGVPAALDRHRSGQVGEGRLVTVPSVAYPDNAQGRPCPDSPLGLCGYQQKGRRARKRGPVRPGDSTSASFLRALCWCLARGCSVLPRDSESPGCPLCLLWHFLGGSFGGTQV